MAQPQLRIGGDASRALPRKLNFTMEVLKTITCPPDKERIYVSDTRQPGLTFMVGRGGSRAFYLYKKVNGRPERKKLGDFGQITVEKARKLAAKDIGKIVDGIDPMAERREMRAADTLQELFDAYLDAKRGEITERTRITDKSRFDTCFAGWKTTKVKMITEQNVRALHMKLGKERGHVTANRAIELLRRVMNWGKVKPNPASDEAVSWYREQPRKRFLRAEELVKLSDAIDQEEEELFRDFFKLALWTGGRRGNVQAMRWADVNLPDKSWIIPAAVAKGKKPIPVPLSPPAVEILDRRLKAQQEHRAKLIADGKAKRDDPPCEWVFPTWSITGHLVEPKGAWKRILERAKLDDLRMHDLRHTFATWQLKTGATLDIVGRTLGHRDLHTTRIYAELDLEDTRPSVNTAAEAMLAAMKAKPGK